MTYLEIVKEFVLFLKENNALKAYKENVYKAHSPQFFSKNKEYELYYYMNPLVCLKGTWLPYDIRNLINHSFTWACTPQGRGYWAHLHSKWMDCVRRKNITYNPNPSLKHETCKK